MTKKISGAEYPLSKIFSSDFDYVIPSYQRPYAWTEVQAGELFSDLYDFFRQEKEETYFLGSIVLIKAENQPHAEVIDGQQRLTTLTILLAAITAQFEGTRHANLAKNIREEGDELLNLKQKPRLALREKDQQFFETYVQNLRLNELLALNPAQLSNESQQKIRKNTELFLQRIQENFADNKDDLFQFASFLVQRCFLVAVSTPSQQSAFRVFSVLNSRGLDLLPTDIIKSDVIGRIQPAKQDEFTDIWEELEVNTGRDGFAEVFGHIRMLYAKDKARRALLDEFRERVITQAPSAESLITDIIQPYANAYSIAKQCKYTSTSNAQDVNILLKWLNRIDNSDWLPPVIKFLADKSAEENYVLWFLQKLERLAAFMHICSYDINSRIDRYALVLRDLEKPHSLMSPIKSIELIDDEKKLMRTKLNGEIYALTARRRNYLILRLDSFLSDGAADYDTSLLTIEHVLPQTIPANSSWTDIWPSEDQRILWLHRLANLVPLNMRRNREAFNYDFDTKKKAYFGGKKGVSSYVLTTQVLNTEKWTPEIVAQRQDDLLSLLDEKWELI